MGKDDLIGILDGCYPKEKEMLYIKKNLIRDFIEESHYTIHLLKKVRS